MMKQILVTLFLLFLASAYAQQSKIEVSGTITDAETGEFVPGATILEKGTSNGVASDFDGNFSIEVAGQESILVVSFVGYKSQEISVGGKTKFNIVLQTDASELDEVVVVAYGTQKKETVTSSVVQIKAEKLADVTTPEVGTMLQGKVTGVQVLPSTGSPGSSPNIVIRGRSSINSTNSPLWVLDGVIIGNSDPKLNPYDVESISVLKDASATSLYGNRGANGVIIVTTKRGKIGDKPRMNVYVKTAINQFNPGKFKVMNSQQLYDYHAELGNPNPWFKEELKERDYDWIDGATQDAFVKDGAVTFTSATETHSLYLSTGLYNEEGTVIGNELNRYTFRTNLDYKISDKLTIKPKFNFVFDRRDRQNQASLYEAYLNLPWDLPVAADGSVVNADQAQGDDWLGRDKRNFFYDRQWNYTDSRSFDLFTSLDFVYKVLPNLTYVSTNNFRYGNFERFSYTDQRSNGGRATNGSINDYTFRGLYRFTNQMLKYSNTFNEDHAVNVLAAYEYSDSSTKDVSTTSENVVVNGQVQGVGLKPAKADGNASEFAQQSVLVSAGYDYKSKYFAKGSLRIDGASAFAKDYRYGEFYSIAAGWNIGKEDFLKDVEQIDALKLRVSHGAVGNQPGGFGYLSLYNVEFQYAGKVAAKPSQLGTADLTWEKAVETNVGIDGTLFNALDFTIDYYNKENSGLLYFRSLSDQTGFRGRWENVGSINNKGLEIAAFAFIVNKEDFSIDLGFNLSFNKNRIKELADGTDIIAGSTIRKEGEEFGTFYMRKWLGVNPGNGAPVYEKIADDGTVSTTADYSDATVQIVGSSNPDFTGGFNTSIRYKDFTLSSNWSFSYGAELYNTSRNLFDSDGFYLQFNQMVLPEGWSRWKQPGDIVTHPKPRVGGYPGSNQTSSRYLEDGSYLRLNNINLSYYLPKSLLDRLGIVRASIYLTGDNLATFTKFSGVDPTIGGAGGFTSLGYPVPRRYALGLNITF